MSREITRIKRQESKSTRSLEQGLRKTISGHAFKIDSLKTQIKGLEGEKKVLVKFGFTEPSGKLDATMNEKFEARIAALNAHIHEEKAAIESLKSQLPPSVFAKLWSWVRRERKEKQLDTAEEVAETESDEADEAEEEVEDLKEEIEEETKEDRRRRKEEAEEEYRKRETERKIRRLEREVKAKKPTGEKEPFLSEEELATFKEMGLKTKL